MRRTTWLSSGLLLAVLAVVLPASANGRFPRAQRLLEDPADSAHLVLTATYGLLETRDRGESWWHVCEAAYGIANLPLDARAAITTEGALLAGVYSGVARAQQSPCDFERTLGFADRQAVPDFTLAASVPGRVIAVHASLSSEGLPIHQLYRSDDDGRTWQTLGEPLPASLRTALTVDVAPSDADRVYVSGLGPDDEGVLLRSDDGGESFTALAIPTDAAQQEYPYIAAVDPANADQVYVRTDVWQYDPETQAAHANDALFYSDDGGASFSELLRAGGKLFGFAFSPDSSELLVGYGDPIQFSLSRMIDPTALGIYRAPKGSSAFEMRYAGRVGCLTWTQEGIYACTTEADTGFSLGLIRDTDFDLGSTAQLEPLLRLRDVAGPLECETCSPGALCLDDWKATCESWGRADCLDLSSGDCGGGGAAGAAGAPSGMAGTAGTSNDQPRARGGCACRYGQGEGGGQGWLVTLLLAIWLRRRRPIVAHATK